MNKRNHICKLQDQVSPIEQDKGVVDPTAFFHVHRSVETIRAIWQKQAASNRSKITAVFDPNVPEILPLDALKVQYCLNNLVSNAVHFTQNGSIKIFVTRLDRPDQQSYLALTVKDNGFGMSPQKLETIFEKQAPRQSKHLPAYGVVETGLPMTRNLIAELGGKVLVKSEQGYGSTFSLLLPLRKDAFACQYPIINSAVENQFADLSILVVDDYNLNQLTIKTLLHDTVSKIYFAFHGYEALEILHSCPVDIVLMDIHMPILDGIETTLKIRESNRHWADVKIVALTADPQYQHTNLCKKIGMDDALAKPILKQDLLRVFAKLT